MDANDVELLDRLKRGAGQIQAQHRRLEPLFEELSRALANGISRDSQTAVFRLDGAIRAHFQLEEKIVFPAIRGLCLQNEAELEAIIGDHRHLGVELQTLVDQILEAQLELAAQSLEKFWLSVRDHESREEGFLEALDSAPSERNL